MLTSVNTPNDIPALFAYNTSLDLVYYYDPNTLASLVYNWFQGAGAPDTPVQVTGINPGDYMDLQATMVNGTPGLYATTTVSTSGSTCTGWCAEPPLAGFSNATTSIAETFTFTVTTGTNGDSFIQAGYTTLDTATHDWPLNDAADGEPFTTAADDAGSQNLAAHGNVEGNTHDAVLGQDAAFDGTTGYLTATGWPGPLNPGDDFTISAWVKPTALGGTVASLGGAQDPVVELSANTQGTWALSLNTTATGTAATYTTISGGHVNLGLWTQLTATYNEATGSATLYADGNEIAVGRDAGPPSDVSGPFALGAAKVGTSYGSFFDGYMADVEIYDAVAVPTFAGAGASQYVPINPARIIDTRSGVGSITGPVASDSTTPVTIAGDTTNGVDIPSTGVTAVALSLTVVGASANGYMSAYPGGTPQPLTSTVNYFSGTTITNNAIVPVGADGKIDIYNGSSGTAQFLIDVTGYFTTNGNAANAGTYTPLTDPTRILDTRKGIGAPQAPVAQNTALALQIEGSIGIPSTSVNAVALNLTALDATGIGQLIAYADGATRPGTSNLNYSSPGALADTVVVPVGTDGKIEIYNSSTGSAVDILADVSGYYTTTTTGQYYFPTGSDRILDTRSYNPATSNASPLTAGEKLTLPIPATAPAANATLVLNITAVAPTSNGDLAVYPGNQSTSTASALNWASGQTIANLNIAASAAGDGINLADQATSGTVDLIIDTDGYFANATPQGRHDVLTHQWPLTDGSGDLANDAAGENPLTFGNGETWTTSTVGAQPNASTVVDLNGADQYGQTVYSAIDTGDSYTVSAWANLDTTPTSDAAVVAKSGDNASAFYLEYSATAKAWCVNYMTHDDQDATGYATIPCAATAPATGTWYHLIATYNAATHTAALYVNGTLADTATGIDGWSSSIGLTIGAAQYNQQMTDYFPGQISNVDTYNYALNATQAAQLYSQQN